MKVVLKNIGGPSPGLMIVGERESLLELASTLRAKVEQASPEQEAEIPLVDSAACDGSKEWISVQVVRDIQPKMKAAEKKGRRLAWGIWAFFAVVAGILILAYFGLMSFIR